LTKSQRRSLAGAALTRLGRRPHAAAATLRAARLLPPGLRTRAYRSLAWPAAKRMSAELDVSVVAGNTMRVRTWDALGRTLAVSGVWEPNVTAVFAHALARGDVCIDIGAHIGYYTLLASKLVGRDGHVYAFEPSPTNFRVLEANLALNRVENVTVIAAAVGAAAGRTRFYEGPGTNTGKATLNAAIARRVSTHKRPVMVDVVTIAETIPEAEVSRVRVVKVDVEGGEVEVLRSLEPIFLAGHPVSVFLEFNPRWLAEADAHYVGRLCSTYGFTMFRFRTGYGLEDLFPRRLVPPTTVDEVPGEMADLLLTR
jgi:FkbM family methyltransferase